MTSKPIYRHDQPVNKPPRWPLYALAGVLLVALGAGYCSRHHGQNALNTSRTVSPMVTATPAGGAGQVLGIDGVTNFTAAQAQALSKQNYGAVAPVITTGITKVTFHYRSIDLNGAPITVYGRAYFPNNDNNNLPIFAFAPGTTGVGPQCAASLENVATASWGNYDSHMVTYASQGYAAVTTDYEGMRDPGHLHHYMVGPLEGRAVLDSIRALGQLSQSKGRLDQSSVFVAGYSQGGHAAFWADTINASYAPDIKLSGVIGYGPVLSVEETMNDVTRGSILNWFGPYVLVSYADYYHQNYNPDAILQPRFAATLTADVTSHCVDTAYSFWGHDPSKVYTPPYLSAIQNGTLGQLYPELLHDLQQNATGTEATTTAKLINQGHYDNVVLPAQAQAALPSMCRASKGPVTLKLYPSATHFNTMVVSLNDTLAWMKQVTDGDKITSTCPAS
ncbi:hypothetical protein HJC99_05665 [Candidatus Saccharibacteria bacterium]|nr:hypothetical protein [Candidatus Saccharibacteria bacterium]